MNVLAIVVPFWKVDYLESLLLALSAQTDNRFTVYIGDDCSPDDPTPVLARFSSTLDIVYHRFERRMGHLDLVAQWMRCVELSRETWLWVLPDDDLPSHNAVAAFYAAVEADVDVSLVYLPTVVCDKHGNALENTFVRKAEINVFELYLSQMEGRMGSFTLASCIYRRAKFDATGGFVNFPKGWGSDHATPLVVAGDAKTAVATQATLYFRTSGDNISSFTNDAEIKMFSRVAYLLWLSQYMKTRVPEPFRLAILRRCYYRDEYYVINVYRFSLRSALLLWQLSAVSEVRDSLPKVLAVVMRGKARALLGHMQSGRRP